MADVFTDPPAFIAFKTAARGLHEAGKIGEARRKIIGARIPDRKLGAAVALIDAWLAEQPQAVRSYALAKPQPSSSQRVISRPQLTASPKGSSVLLVRVPTAWRFEMNAYRLSKPTGGSYAYAPRWDVQVIIYGRHVAWHEFRTREAAVEWMIAGVDARDASGSPRVEPQEFNGSAWATLPEVAAMREP